MSVNEGKVVIIFSGYNNRAVVSFIRTLEKNRINYVVIARDNKDPIFSTTYRDNIVLTRENQCLDLNLIKKCIEVIQSEFTAVQYFIAPSTEALNRFLQIERDALEKMNVLVPLPDADIYVSVSDKKEFSDICQEHGMLVPDEYDSITDTVFPFVAKPRKYLSRNGAIYTPSLIFNRKQKDLFLENCDPEDFYFQKFIEGRSIYLLYYFHRNGLIFKFSQENMIQQPHGKSIIAAISSDFHTRAESIKYENLFRKIKFYGLVMVELKVNNNKNYMIEANPRFWGPSQLFVDAGSNLFEVFMHDHEFIDKLPVFDDSGKSRYFWFGGIQQTLKERGELSFHTGCEKDFLLNLDTWLYCDVFKRSDTIGIFKEEII